MRALLIVLALGVALAAPALADASPPANDQFAGATAIAALPYILVARLAWRRRVDEVVIGAMCSSYCNAGNLGLPIAAYVLGDASLIAPMLLLQLVVLQPIALAVLDAGRTGRVSLGRAVRTPLTNPLTLGPIYLGTHALGRWLIGLAGYGEGAGAMGSYINALVVGGVVAGLGLALACDLAWRLLAWEARHFRDQVQAMRAALHHATHREDDAGPPAP